MAHQVFVSYSSTDKPVADALCARLESCGIRCWIAPRDVLPSQMYGEAIVNAIQASRLMVLVFSGEANSSQQVLREVERAASKAVPILPFRIENVPLSPSMEYFISAPHWLDAMTKPLDEHLERLAATAKQILAGGETVAQAAPERAPPSMPPPAAVGPRPANSRLPLLLSGAALLIVVAGGAWVISRSWNQQPAEPRMVVNTAPPRAAPFAAATPAAAIPPGGIAQPRMPAPAAQLTPQQRQVIAHMTPQQRQAAMQLPPQQRQALLHRLVMEQRQRHLAAQRARRSAAAQ